MFINTYIIASLASYFLKQYQDLLIKYLFQHYIDLEIQTSKFISKLKLKK